MSFISKLNIEISEGGKLAQQYDVWNEDDFLKSPIKEEFLES